jgi:hypothetical protein
MERIMERIVRHSLQQLQAFIGQGELISLISLKFLKIYSFCIMILSMEFVVLYSLLYIMERSWAAAGFPAACPKLRLGLRSEARVSGAKMCDSKHCLVFT